MSKNHSFLRKNREMAMVFKGKLEKFYDVQEKLQKIHDLKEYMMETACFLEKIRKSMDISDFGTQKTRIWPSKLPACRWVHRQ